MGQLERGRTAARAAVAIPAAARDEGQRREPRRSLRRLGSSQRAVALLAAVALISAFGLAGITYVAARANAISAAQTRARQDAQVARQLILDQGANVTVHDGQLVVGVDDQGYTLNGDTT